MSNLFHKVADDESIRKEDLDPIVKSILSSLNQPDLFKTAGGQVVGASSTSSGSGDALGDDDGAGAGGTDDVMLDDVLNDILDEDDADADGTDPLLLLLLQRSTQPVLVSAQPYSARNHACLTAVPPSDVRRIRSVSVPVGRAQSAPPARWRRGASAQLL